MEWIPGPELRRRGEAIGAKGSGEEPDAVMMV
jgi:hypothetical protein